MRRIIFVLALLTLPFVLPLPARAQGLPGEQGVEKGVFPDREANILPDIPEGAMITIDERDWAATLSDEPALKLEDAMKEFANGNTVVAADDIAKAVSHTRVAAARSSGDIRDLLLVSAAELKDLGNRVKTGQVSSPGDLALPFARDLQALAWHHAAQAAEYWDNDHNIDAGYDLRAAAEDLGHAVTWSKSGDRLDVSDMVTRADFTAELILSGQSVEREEVAGLITGLEQASRQLGEILRNPKS